MSDYGQIVADFVTRLENTGWLEFCERYTGELNSGRHRFYPSEEGTGAGRAAYKALVECVGSALWGLKGESEAGMVEMSSRWVTVPADMIDMWNAFHEISAWDEPVTMSLQKNMESAARDALWSILTRTAENIARTWVYYRDNGTMPTLPSRY